MLGRRILTAVLGIPIMLALIYFGGWVMTIGAGILASIMVWEVSTMYQARNMVFFARMGVFWVWALMVTRMLGLPTAWALVAGLLVTVIGAVVLGREATSFEGALTTAWASLYIGLLFSFLVALRNLSHGALITLGFFMVIWATDAMAFFVGRELGGPKLLPHISPKKTWSGTLGGTLSAMIVGALVAPWMHIGWWHGGLYGLVVSATGQVGDLFESQFKRYVGVKDSSGILPGHGGIFDRFDSVLFALPFAYYFLRGLGIG